MECSAGQSVWHDAVQYLQDQRGERQEQAKPCCYPLFFLNRCPVNLHQWIFFITVPHDVRVVHRCVCWRGHHFVGTGEYLVFCCVLFLARNPFFFRCLSPHWGTKVFATHVTSWRWESRRWGISELRDWCLLYCCSLVFPFAPSHTERHHNNNAVMSAFFHNGQMESHYSSLRFPPITKNTQNVFKSAFRG